MTMPDTPDVPLVDPATVRDLTADEYDATYADAQPHDPPPAELFADVTPTAEDLA